LTAHKVDVRDTASTVQMRSPVVMPSVDAARLWGDVMALGDITEAERPYTRRSFSPTFARGRAWLAERMQEAGLVVRTDAGGNLIGRREGSAADAATLMVGSHSDTVPEGGRFDGIAGVLVGLELARALRDAGCRLAHAFEVVDFLAEEPSEFGLSCIGSRALAGALEPAQLALTGPGGESLHDALVRVGGAPGQLERARRGDVAAFLELHIEQGPVLEATRIDVGVVSSIVGITRIELRFDGAAAHAGTAPMSGRRDAAVAAAQAILAARDLARALDGGPEGYFVATCGVVEVRPNASNVVPGQARVVVDARSERAASMQRFCAELKARVDAIAGDGSGVAASWQVLSHNDPAACDAALQRVLAASAQQLGLRHRSMASGAGHDAAFVARVAPSAMLFVPCREGRSHCPQEWTDSAELAAGAAVMLAAVQRLDRELPLHRVATERAS